MVKLEANKTSYYGKDRDGKAHETTKVASRLIYQCKYSRKKLKNGLSLPTDFYQVRRISSNRSAGEDTMTSGWSTKFLM